jgi:quercetin dioxygenase-like cupin family protein
LTQSPAVVDLEPLKSSSGTARMTGEAHGLGLSLITVDGKPGDGPELHVHPYPETFVVVEGTVRFVVGDDEIVATGGMVVIGPAHVPHRFTIEGQGRARLVNIHSSPSFQTTWL